MTIAASAPRTILTEAKPGWWVAPTFVPEIGIVHEDVGQDIGPTDRRALRRI